jgi:lysophospholipase L1-like esterase
VFPCAVLGDSLAAGVAMQAPACVAVATVGITSAEFDERRLQSVDAAVVLISLGANDVGRHIRTAEHLLAVRKRIQAGRVYWLLPARPETVRSLISATAFLFGDRLIDTQGSTGADGLHLTAQTYRIVSKVLDPTFR